MPEGGIPVNPALVVLAIFLERKCSQRELVMLLAVHDIEFVAEHIARVQLESTVDALSRHDLSAIYKN